MFIVYLFHLSNIRFILRTYSLYISFNIFYDAYCFVAMHGVLSFSIEYFDTD